MRKAIALIPLLLAINHVMAFQLTVPLSGKGMSCSAGYASKGYACPSVEAAGPTNCGTGWTSVPSMRIPTDTSGGTIVVPGFCVSTYINNGSTIPSANTVPQVYISWNAAVSACPSGSQLIRESQWMALAHNITLVPENWSGEAIDSGDIKGGLNSSQCASQSARSYNDCPDASAPGRERTLTNGEKVYDIGGNVWQWTYHDLAGGSGGKFSNITRDQTAAPYDSQSRGMGWIPDSVAGNAGYTLPYGSWSSYAPSRGGSWSYGTYAGPFDLSGNGPSYTGPYIGFRCTK